MHNLSSQTRTFVLILFFACAAAYAALTVNSRLNWLEFPQIEKASTKDSQKVTEDAFNENINARPDNQDATLLKAEDSQALEVENWETYNSNSYNFSFRHPRTWLVSFNELDDNFNTIEIKPMNGETIKIYISTRGYFALEGFARTNTTVGNRSGFTIDNIIYGVLVGTNYFTFDNSSNPAYNDQFVEIVKSARF